MAARQALLIVLIIISTLLLTARNRKWFNNAKIFPGAQGILIIQNATYPNGAIMHA